MNLTANPPLKKFVAPDRIRLSSVIPVSVKSQNFIRQQIIPFHHEAFWLLPLTAQQLETLAESTSAACLDKIPLTSISALGNNPPSSSSRGAFMSVPSSVFSVLLMTADAGVQAQFKQAFRDTSITVVRDAVAFRKEATKHQFDAVIVESRSATDEALALREHINQSRTLVMTGSRAVLKKMAKTFQSMDFQNGHGLHQGKTRDHSLESYLESKMGEFVKGMRNGAAKNLHPMLISAVERPLITSALRETRGNQIQAAELLGLNRNTLRKKIAELHIPLKQLRAKSDRAV